MGRGGSPRNDAGGPMTYLGPPAYLAENFSQLTSDLNLGGVMTTLPPTIRFCCPAPRPMGGACGRFVIVGRVVCHAHEACDPERRCQAIARRGAACQAWPLVGKERCADHDPDQRKGRRSRQGVPELLTSKEARAFLKVSAATFYRLLRAGMPFLGTGPLRRFHKAALCEWWVNLSYPAGRYRCTRCGRVWRREIPTPPEYRICQCGGRGQDIKRIGPWVLS